MGEFKNFRCSLKPLFVQEASAIMSAYASGISIRVRLVETRWWKRIQVSHVRIAIDSLEVTPHAKELPWYLSSFLASFPDALKQHVCNHLETELHEYLSVACA